MSAEDEHVQAFLRKSQSTHGIVPSNAAALLAIRLTDEYFLSGTSLSITEPRPASSSSPEINTWLLSVEGIGQPLAEHMVTNIIEKTRLLIEPATWEWLNLRIAPDQQLNEFDKVTLQFKHADASVTEQVWYLPFRQVFATVLVALSDLNPEKWIISANTTAERECEERLSNFCNTLNILARNLICRTGNRHALLQCLDGYEGKRLPLDFEDVISQTLRQYVIKKIEEHLHVNLSLGPDKSPARIEKGKAFIKAFKSHFLPWILDAEVPKDIMLLLDPEAIAQSIHNCFELYYRITPHVGIQKLIRDTADNVQYIACDFTPFLATLTHWRATHATHYGLKEMAAPVLETIDWLTHTFGRNQTCASTSEIHRPDDIQIFYLMDRLFDAKRKIEEEHYTFLLALSDVPDQTRADFLFICDYLTSLVSLELLLSADNLAMLPQRLTDFERISSRLLAESYHSFISNFFAIWFSADDTTDSRPRGPCFTTLMQLLINESDSAKKVIYINDSEMDVLKNNHVEGSVHWLTPYYINRIFLHALSYSPDAWSEKFALFLRTVIDIVKKQCNTGATTQHSRLLKRDSYPQDLLWQMDWLYSRYQAFVDGKPLPELPFFMPLAVLTPALLSFKQSNRAIIYYLQSPRASIDMGQWLIQHNAFDVHEKYYHPVHREYTPLHCAALLGNAAMIEALIQGGASVDTCDMNDYTPLHLAAMYGHAAAAIALLERGARRCAVTNAGETPLHMASWNGHADIVKILLMRPDSGPASYPDSFINARMGRDRSGDSAIRLAVRQRHLRVVEILLDNNAKIDRLSYGDTNLLSVAIVIAYVEAVDLIIKKYPRTINKQFDDKCSPLDLAIEHGHVEVAKRLLSHGADFPSDYSSPTSVRRKIKETPFLELFNDEISRRQALAEKIQSGQLDEVNQLLDSGVSPNARCFRLHQPPLVPAVKAGHLSIVQTLLEHGADVDCWVRRSPFHLAARSGHLLIVQMLLNYGQNINMTNYNDRTALHLAVRYKQHEVMAFLLTQKHIELNKCDKNAHTPLHLALLAGEEGMALSLLNAGADPAFSKGSANILCYAIRADLTTVVKELLAHPRVNVLSGGDGKDLPPPSEVAILNGNMEIMAMLRAKIAEVRGIPLTGTASNAVSSSAFFQPAPAQSALPVAGNSFVQKQSAVSLS
ncbi:ankyrin repeat domain-containing protein [Legionella sp. CNM-4043-24]|uniref:ankyrin repeat domain-containing protein n=1 Tax=Legionella sp. CNM-4043-24 TaxID=3421646 RepID=UPI00403AAAC4